MNHWDLTGHFQQLEPRWHMNLPKYLQRPLTFQQSKNKNAICQKLGEAHAGVAKKDVE